MKNNALILFTRIPIIDKTKTRLQPFLTGVQCCLLHEAFLADIHSTLLKATTEFDLIVFYTPEGNIDTLQALLSNAASFIPQCGENIGEKMDHAITAMLTLGYKKCLLIGSDIPHLNADTIDESFEMLNHHDLVICPTLDGGYYLIGSKTPCRTVFEIPEFGTSSVFEKTLAAAKSTGRSYAVSTATFDIDLPSDLLKLAKLLDETESTTICTKTQQVIHILKANGILIYD
ncbi:MAG: TIGR04282 family arsenosugar biosynthesis glycosyltransferase [Oscillospiraceae bacterium]|nr:TIGR04282 family arsenosugar biosynthesis glycosyltransferase [Oscillospiraceae bacterium]